MLLIIPLIIIILALAVIIIIASRHVPKVASLETSELPEAREAQLKSTLLEARLIRKFDTFFSRFKKITQPIQQQLGRWYGGGVKRLKRLERAYRLQGETLPDSNKKSEARATELLEKASLALEQQKLVDAEADYLTILKIDPSRSAAYEGLGQVYLARGEWDAAQETFEYVTKQWPQHDGAYAALGDIAQKNGTLEDAKDHYLHALSINNEVVGYHLDLVDVYLGLGDKEKALSSLQKAQQLEPNNPKILDRILHVSILLGNKPLAEEAYDKIVRVNPENGKLEDYKKRIKALK